MSEQMLILHPSVETEALSIFDGVVFGEDTQQWMDWIEAYHAWLKSKRRRSGGENTVKTYTVAWRQFYRFAQCKPWDVTPKLAQRWAAYLTNAEKLAESTVNLKLAAMSSFYDFVQKQYALWPANARNPFVAVERNKVSPYGRAHYPSVDEARAMLAVINTECLQGSRDFALLFTFLTTCRRSSEVLNLQWGDISEKGDGDYVFSYRYKGGEQKRQAMDRRCFQVIETYLRMAGRLETMADSDFIFTPLDPDRAARLSHIDQVDPNQPLSNAMANKILKKYARRAGVSTKKAHIHGLRHAGARLRVQLMRDGNGSVDFEEVMHLLGHSSLAVTQIYATTILTDPEDKGAAAAVEALMPTGKPKRRRKAAPENQIPMEAANPETAAAEINRLRAELEQLKAGR